MAVIAAIPRSWASIKRAVSGEPRIVDGHPGRLVGQIYFKTGSWSLDSRSEKAIENLAKQYAFTALAASVQGTFYGHADLRRSTVGNRNLARERAGKVRRHFLKSLEKLLNKKAVSGIGLDVSSQGDAQSRFKNKKNRSVAALAHERRVDIKFLTPIRDPVLAKGTQREDFTDEYSETLGCASSLRPGWKPSVKKKGKEKAQKALLKKRSEFRGKLQKKWAGHQISMKVIRDSVTFQNDKEETQVDDIPDSYIPAIIETYTVWHRCRLELDYKVVHRDFNPAWTRTSTNYDGP